MERIKCKICEAEFYAKAIGKNHYIATDTTSTILAEITTKHYYDAFDCPICKCQNILGERKKRFISAVSENVIPDEVTFIEKENKTLCDRCDKQDKECNCDCTREFEEKEERRNKLKEHEPKCFGCYNESLEGCRDCKLSKDCNEKYERRCKLQRNGCYGKYTEKNIACVEKCELRDLCRYYATGKTDE